MIKTFQICLETFQSVLRKLFTWFSIKCSGSLKPICLEPFQSETFIFVWKHFRVFQKMFTPKSSQKMISQLFKLFIKKFQKLQICLRTIHTVPNNRNQNVPKRCLALFEMFLNILECLSDFRPQHRRSIRRQFFQMLNTLQ